MRSGQFSERPEPPAASFSKRSGRRFVVAAQHVLDRIQTGRLAPGDRLPPDRTLAVDLEVSRATVREALLALELLGVVEIRHGSGVYVVDPAKVTRDSDAWFVPTTSALFEARATIEPKLAQMCALRMSTADIRAMSASVSRARAAVTREVEFTEFAELQVEFHRMLADHCGSPLLADTARSLVSAEEHPLWVLLNQQAIGSPELRMQQVAEHAAVLGHIKKRDPDAARAAMHRHVTDLGCTLVGSDWIS